MALLIGAACSNENTEITGGKAGDQTGREVRINTFYDGQVWQTIFRCKDKAKAKMIGQYMKDACLNDVYFYTIFQSIRTVHLQYHSEHSQ